MCGAAEADFLCGAAEVAERRTRGDLRGFFRELDGVSACLTTTRWDRRGGLTTTRLAHWGYISLLALRMKRTRSPTERLPDTRSSTRGRGPAGSVEALLAWVRDLAPFCWAAATHVETVSNVRILCGRVHMRPRADAARPSLLDRVAHLSEEPLPPLTRVGEDGWLLGEPSPDPRLHEPDPTACGVPFPWDDAPTPNDPARHMQAMLSRHMRPESALVTLYVLPHVDDGARLWAALQRAQPPPGRPREPQTAIFWGVGPTCERDDPRLWADWRRWAHRQPVDAYVQPHAFLRRGRVPEAPSDVGMATDVHMGWARTRHGAALGLARRNAAWHTLVLVPQWTDGWLALFLAHSGDWARPGGRGGARWLAPAARMLRTAGPAGVAPRQAVLDVGALLTWLDGEDAPQLLPPAWDVSHPPENRLLLTVALLQAEPALARRRPRGWRGCLGPVFMRDHDEEWPAWSEGCAATHARDAAQRLISQFQVWHQDGPRDRDAGTAPCLLDLPRYVWLCACVHLAANGNALPCVCGDHAPAKEEDVHVPTEGAHVSAKEEDVHVPAEGKGAAGKPPPKGKASAARDPRGPSDEAWKRLYAALGNDWASWLWREGAIMQRALLAGAGHAPTDLLASSWRICPPYDRFAWDPERAHPTA